MKLSQRLSRYLTHLKKSQNEVKRRCFADLGGETERDKLGIIPRGVFTDVLCFSDPHADIGVVFEAIEMACILEIHDDRLVWKAPPTERWAIVVNGDLMDRLRGPLTPIPGHGEIAHEEHLILVFLNSVDLLARQHKSRLFKMPGNHEVMNMYGQFANVTQLGLDSFGSGQERWKSFQSGGEMNLQLQACGTYALLKIDSLLFVHAGIVTSLVNQIRALRHGETDFIPFANRIFQSMLTLPQSEWKKQLEPWISLLFSQPDSLLWTRRYSDTQVDVKSSERNQELRQVFTALGFGEEADKMTLIVGHTPQVYRCFAEITQPIRVQCKTSGYVLKDKVSCKGKSCGATMFAGPFVQDSSSFHTITFGALTRLRDQVLPQLVMLDVAHSRAFDNPQDTARDKRGQTLREARKTAALRINLTGSLPRFSVLQSQNSLPRG